MLQSPIEDHRHLRRAPSLFALARRKLSQFRVEVLGGCHFRGQDPNQVRLAYDRMDEKTFRAINGSQEWVNCRQIPRSMRGWSNKDFALVIDLGCGPGSSTCILAWYGHPTWRIIGIDLAPELIDRARRSAPQGRLQTRTGPGAEVEFVVGSVTETLRDANGLAIPDSSVWYVNSSGIVGHHLTVNDFRQLASELARVIMPGGAAALDSGPFLKAGAIKREMHACGFRLRRRVHAVPFDPRPQLVFERLRRQS